jgi:hypothetical protein
LDSATSEGGYADGVERQPAGWHAEMSEARNVAREEQVEGVVDAKSEEESHKGKKQKG